MMTNAYLTRPSQATIAPARPESAKTDSLPSDTRPPGLCSQPDFFQRPVRSVGAQISDIVLKAAILTHLVILLGCAQSAHQSGQYLFDRLVPKDLRQQVDPDISFSELKASPSAYEGKVIMLNGVILNAKRAKDRTEIEVLQVPSKSSFGPSQGRSRSEGRFLAVQEGAGLDPAVVEEGNPVTVIGEVKGTVVKSLDEGQYTYPVLEIKQLVDWQKTMSSEYSGYGPHPYYGGYYGYYPYQYYPYWGPYRYYPYGYGFYPYGFGFSSPSPAPSPPPSGSIPPQFKKGR